jgi:hypothetical protein
VTTEQIASELGRIVRTTEADLDSESADRQHIVEELLRELSALQREMTR